MACIPDPLGSGSAPNSRYKPRPAAIKANRPNIRCIGAHLFAARRSTVCCLIDIGSVAAAGQHTVNAIRLAEPYRRVPDHGVTVSVRGNIFSFDLTSYRLRVQVSKQSLKGGLRK